MAVNSFREDEYMENTDKKKILSRLLSYLFIADRRGDRSLHSAVRF